MTSSKSCAPSAPSTRDFGRVGVDRTRKSSAGLAEQRAVEFDRTEKVFGRAQNNEPWRQQVLAGCDLFTNTAIYMFPRYVVSYALSIVCAQQLKAAYDADPVDGWARYHALCASGGSKLYAETLADAGLELPYAPGVVERLARELAAQA